MKKRKMSRLISLLLLLCLAACGREETGEEEIDYTYVLAEFEGIEKNEYVSYEDIQFSGDSMYYIWNYFNVDAQTNTYILKEYSLEENKILQERNLVNVEDGSKRRVYNYYVQKDGTMYTYEECSQEGYAELTSYLCFYDKQGKLLWEKDITAVLDGVEKRSQVNDILADEDGRIYLCVNQNTFCLFDREGRHQGNVEPGDVSVSGCGVGRDGKVYASYRDGLDEVYCLWEIDFDKVKMGNVYRNFLSGSFSAGTDNDLLINDGRAVYGYDLAAESYGELFQWVDCDLNGFNVDNVSAIEEGRLAYLSRSNGRIELGFLDKMAVADIPEKTQIILGVFGADSFLQEEVAAFNRQSDNFHVTFRVYEAKDYETTLGIALATGIDCPDIIDLSQLGSYHIDVESLAQNGAFEDLGAFLLKSGSLDRDDYLGNVLESYTCNGVLYGLPYDVRLSIVAGRKADVGEEPGWSLMEMMDYYARNLGSELYAGADRSGMLYFCMAFNQDSFIDRETGQCSFDSEEFMELLSFVKDFPEAIDWNAYWADGRNDYEKLRDGDVLLYMGDIDEFDDVQKLEAYFGEKVTCIGYPVIDVSNIGCILAGEGTLGICAQSSQKEGAWEFIEYYLTEEFNSAATVGFPPRESVLEREMEMATSACLTDENGEPLLDDDGNPQLRPYRSEEVVLSMTERYAMHPTTEEETQLIKKLLEAATPAPAEDDRVMQIIAEEAAPYFLGQKSVEETVGIIQSRIQLYINE